ncbi:uncharacterized protein [Eurosta solidaginis]|uniref:uncharacterized protein n=1 Tax=Eurosta solidaginis TaxID=178769 RepID=UPI0035313752
MKLYLYTFDVMLIGCLLVINVKSGLEFTNVKCNEIDKSSILFDSCEIKSINRTYKYLFIHIKFPKRELIYNVTTTFALLRKASGYKPFLYNFTVDAWKYLKKRNNPVINYFHSWFEKYSTLNRSCPYGPIEETINKVPINHISRLTSDILPLPAGEYALHTTWIFYKKRVATVLFYFQIN